MKKLVTSSLVVSFLLAQTSLFSQMTSVNKQDSLSDNSIVMRDLELTGKISSNSGKSAKAQILSISRKEIQELSISSIDELLQYNAGLDVRRRGPMGIQSDLSVRGGNFEQVLILINGFRMTDTQTGHNSLALPIPLDAIDRIEIVKGSAARRYGQNAIAGVINIVTQAKKPNLADIGITGGDFTFYQLRADAAKSWEDVNLRVSASHTGSTGYRRNTDFTATQSFANFYTKINENNSFAIQGGFLAKKFGAAGFYTNLFPDQYEETQVGHIGIGHEYKKENIIFNSKVGWRWAQDEFTLFRYNPAKPKNFHIGNNLNAELGLVYNNSLGESSIGVEGIFEGIDSNNLGNRNRRSLQLYAAHEFSLLNRNLNILPSLTVAMYDTPISKSFFYPGADFTYKFKTNQNLFFSIGRGNRLPSFTELYYNTAANKGFEGLVPEESFAMDLGYSIAHAGTQIQASVFQRTLKNGVDFVRNDIKSPWIATNSGEIQTRGVEVSWKERWGSFLSTTINYTYLDQKMDVPTGKISKYVMENLRHQLAALASFHINKNLYIGPTFRFYQRVSLPDYSLFDAKLEYRAAQFTIFTQAQNIADKKYTEIGMVPMSGRWWTMGINFKIR